jgi:flagellin
MIINHNMSAAYANRTLGVQGATVAKNIEKLSSGMRINRAGDDASDWQFLKNSGLRSVG